jgi:hypothetical protein
LKKKFSVSNQLGFFNPADEHWLRRLMFDSDSWGIWGILRWNPESDRSSRWKHLHLIQKFWMSDATVHQMVLMRWNEVRVKWHTLELGCSEGELFCEYLERLNVYTTLRFYDHDAKKNALKNSMPNDQNSIPDPMSQQSISQVTGR